MKKFYTLILATAVAFAASATAITGKINKDALKASPAFLQSTLATKAPGILLQGIEKQTVDKANRIKPVQSWEDVDNVVYTEALISSFGSDSQELEVLLQVDNNNENHFRLVNPYKNWINKFEDVKIDDSKDYYMEFTITGDYVTFTDGELGLLVYDEENDEWLPIGFMTQAYGILSAYGVSVETLASVYPDAVGIIENNVINYPAFMTETDENGVSKKYNNFLIWFGTADNIVSGGNMNGSFQIVMPGGVADPNAGWENYGTGELTDGLLCNFFKDVEPQTMTVQFQKSTRVDGVYRIINPYQTWESPFTDLTYNSAVTRYMVIHCEEAPYVWIEDIATGMFITEEGEIKALSPMGYYCQQMGATMVAQYYPDGVGVLNGRTITYGASMQAQNQAGETQTSPNWLGYTGALDEQTGFWGGLDYPIIIELPDPSGINDAVIDLDSNAPVEYFNLQGVRVANPAAGELVIKRQGNNVSKAIIR